MSLKSEHYKYPEPYETGNITIVRAVLGDDTSQCPHCNTNHRSWAMRDDRDLYCFHCGWRESLHFAYDYTKELFIGREKLVDDKALGFRPRRDYNGYTLIYGNGCHKFHNCFQCKQEQCSYEYAKREDRKANHTKANVRLEALT